MTKARDLANASTALSAVSATELGYLDGVTSAVQTQIDAKLASSTAATTYVANSLADAKGDIFVASADNTVTRLPVGSTGDTIVADSSTATGLRYQSAYNGNGCINGGFDIWQRGTSFTSQYVYTADRWFRDNQPDRTFSRQASGLTDFEYSMRVQRNSGATGTSATGLVTSFETSESIKYQGQTVTLSFYAKAGANFSATSSALPVNVYTGTGTNQRRDFGTGFTGEANPINTSVTLTTSWQRFSVTGTISSTATELAIMFYFSPTGTASTNDWFEITGVQLELGSVATTFKRAGGTIQGELAACQRYYYRVTDSDTSSMLMGLGTAISTTVVWYPFAVKSTLRAAPTTLDYANIRVHDGVTGTNATNVDIVYNLANFPVIRATVASGLTQFRQYFYASQSSTVGYIGVSAEL